jgi:hypothetical protein
VEDVVDVAILMMMCGMKDNCSVNDDDIVVRLGGVVVW